MPDYDIILIVVRKNSRRAFRTAALAIVCASFAGLVAGMFVKMHPVGGIVLCLTAMTGILTYPDDAYDGSSCSKHKHEDNESEDGKTKA